MSKRSLALLLGVLLILGTAAAAPAAYAADSGEDAEGSAPAPEARRWDDGPNTLTVTISEAYADLDDHGTQAPEGSADPLGVVYDLYYVARPKNMPGYDAYTYASDGLTGAFSALADSFSNMDAVDIDAWRDLAWQAASQVLDPGAEGAGAGLKAKPFKANLPVDVADSADTPDPAKAVNDLEAGLYLVIAHGNGMDPADYIVQMEDEDGQTRVGTKAHSRDHVYLFQPELVSLPGQNTVKVNGEPAFDGAWNHDVTATLKPTRDLRYGRLTIRKSIDSYELEEPATFVFEVTAEKDGEEVYRNEVGMTFSGDRLQKLVLDHIPLWAKVTVREIYSGATYTPVTDEQTGEVVLEGLTLEFENRRGPNEKHGHGIVNQFTYDGDEGKWDWVQTPGGPQEPEA